MQLQVSSRLVTLVLKENTSITDAKIIRTVIWWFKVFWWGRRRSNHFLFCKTWWGSSSEVPIWKLSRSF